MKHDQAFLADLASVPLPQDVHATFVARLFRFFGRMRFQLAVGLIVGIALPAMLRGRLQLFAEPLARQEYTTFATLSGFLIGFIVFRKVTAFPGVRAVAYIVPAFAAAYAAVALLFALVRVEYSREELALSAIFIIIFFYVSFSLSRRNRRLEFAVVPGVNARLLSDFAAIDWKYLTRPEAGGGNTPIVADFRKPIDAAWERFIADSVLAGRAVYDAKHVLESLSGRVLVEHLSENTFGSLIPNSLYASSKRYFDFLLAMIAALAFLPLFLLVALLIRLDSRGPALFVQERMGYRGKVFKVYKFRTMISDSDRVVGINAAMTQDDDPRITRIGRLLRKTRIDELPQIINVLKGEMSWIGPRPEAVTLSRWYEEHLPFYRYRHVIRPGITGWAQVNQGHVTSLTDVDRKLQYDFFYVRNFSLWLDVLVFIRTLRIVITGAGAK